jgi:hypothetical protein
MKELGYGAGYQYAHAVEAAYVPQDYLPDAVREAPGYEPFYTPGPFGFERKVAERLAWWRGVRARADGGASPLSDAGRDPGGTVEGGGPPGAPGEAPARVVPPDERDLANDPHQETPP